VLSRGVDRTDYAAQVLHVARALGRHRLSLPAVATAMAHPSGLEWRIRMMLNDRLNRAPLTRSARLATAITLIAIALPLAGFGAAQQNQASITSTVVDQSGAPVKDAEVTLTAPDCEPRTLTPDANGRFVANGLVAGPYRIWVKAMGFAPATESMTLSPNQRVERRLRLSLGTVQETMVLRGANPTPQVTAPLSEAQIHEIVTGPGKAQVSLAPPSRLRAAMPPYPPALHDAGVHGTVILEGDIGVDGAIANPTVVQSVHPELDAVCRDAVLQWRYNPTRLHGVPAAVHIRMVFEFQL
jgi:TonB family protein